MTTGLNDRVVVVTGASGDLGRAIVSGLLAEGARVVAVGRNSPPEGVPHFIRTDLRQREEIAAMGREVENQFGGADAFVHAAGINHPGLAARLPETSWDETLAVNLTSALHCAQALLPGMMLKRAGSIVLISSAAARHPLPGQTAYAASKGGLESLTRALAKELAPRGIRVNALAPGMITSRMTAGMAEDFSQKIKGQIPLARFGTTEEAAACALFLLGERAAYITGQVLDLDGGWGM
jgi:3-oxoacyl-[acyl-carrier protein] reductase